MLFSSKTTIFDGKIHVFTKKNTLSSGKITIVILPEKSILVFPYKHKLSVGASLHWNAFFK
jgi:hypothetical protein